MKIFVAVAIAFSLAAQEQVTPPPPAAPRQVNIPTPSEKTLPNGLRVIVVQKKGLPLVAARLLIKTGSEADPADHGGLADMTGTLLIKGTTTRSSEEIARGVEALGATIESGAGWDQSFVGLTSLSTSFPQAMGFLADVVRNPTFKKEELDRQRDQNLDSIRVAMQRPGSLANYVAARVLFGTMPYGHNTGGTPESLPRITRNDLVSFHKKYYRPDNALLVIAGDIEPQAAFAVAQKQLGGWKKGGAAMATITVKNAVAAPAPRVVVIDMPNAGQAAVVVARQGIRRVDPAYSVAEVTNSILGGGYSARLNQEIRIKRGLSYGARSGFDVRREVGPFTASAQTKNESAAEVAGIILDEIGRLGTTSVPESELTPRKAVLIGGFSRSLETSAGLVNAIADLALYGVSLEEIKRYIVGVQSVTAADVQKFAGAKLGAQPSVIIVGDAKKFLEPLKARFKDVEVIPAAELDLSSPGLRRK
ncbi:MAG TPA: pitrilysin family protein [Thermoanaerobaculia bacterium]|nr:pitrilysin family protein [Thermoanaerobaculia bacterium]